MPFKKGKPLGRRPVAAKSNITRVAELIPENGIRYNDLKKECDKISIGEKAMNNALKKLLADGTIVKEAVLPKSGAGTCYKRMYPQPMNISQSYRIFDVIERLKRSIKKGRDHHKIPLCLTPSQMRALGIRWKYSGRHKIPLVDSKDCS